MVDDLHAIENSDVILIEEPPVQLFKTIIESMEDSIIVTTPDLESPGPIIVYVNDSFTQMTGYSRKEVIGKSPRIFQGPKTDKEKLKHLKEILISGKGFCSEIINYRKDGSTYWIEWQVSPMIREGKVVYWIAIQRLVDNRKLHESKINDILNCIRNELSKLDV